VSKRPDFLSISESTVEERQVIPDVGDIQMASKPMADM
jgi:hypothetical protein